MPSLTENPHCASLLAQRGITIHPTITSSRGVFGTNMVHIGDVKPQGTVVGFCVKDGKCYMVSYDEAKEGQNDALTVEEIQGGRVESVE